MSDITFRYMPVQPFKALSSAGVGSARSAKPNWSKAFNLVRYELGRIGATDIVVEAGYKPHQIRNDGWPLSAATPEHGQVRISFRRGAVPMSFIQSGFKSIEFNVWLIGMTLKALRAVDRYGCTQGGEQYRGWAQLPAGHAIQVGEFANTEDAARFLAQTAGYIGGGSAESIRLAAAGGPALVDFYRDAAKKAHPDQGGSNELMGKVNRAKDFIEKHTGR